MSTHAAIAMKNEDGTILTVYVQNDGHVAGVGAILGGWYTEPAKVKALLELGDLSVLETQITPEPETAHSFAKPQSSVTIAYHRDRGEPLKPPRKYRNVKEFVRKADDDFRGDYLYLYDGGKWFVYGVGNNNEWIESSVKTNNEGK